MMVHVGGTVTGALCKHCRTNIAVPLFLKASRVLFTMVPEIGAIQTEEKVLVGNAMTPGVRSVVGTPSSLAPAQVSGRDSSRLALANRDERVVSGYAAWTSAR